MHGFLVIDKPAGLSSAAVVGKIKWMLPKIDGKKPKIGHGGTLDPLATGLLPIGIGKATKRLQPLLEGPKTYRFTIAFGTQTTTDDAEGTPVSTTAQLPTAAQLQAVLPQFTGSITQLPPAFSALKIAGKRAYQLARAGEEVTLQPRHVTVFTLKMLESTPTAATFEASVSKGTYIRSLARDMALAAGSLGHVSQLRRTAHGPFTLQNAILLDTLLQTGDIAAHLLALDACPAEVPHSEETPQA